MRKLALLIPALAVLAGCGAAPVTTEVTSANSEVLGTSGATEEQKIANLTAALAAMGPGVDPAEAARVAKIAVEYPLHTLAPRYQITDPPLVHNTKVNMGIKPRGLCKDWADDLEARLRQEGLKTISLHRAIANHNNWRIEHSTVIVSAAGAPMKSGIVLDPWRQGGGVLFWSRVTDDPKYDWWARQDVFDYKRRHAALR